VFKMDRSSNRHDNESGLARWANEDRSGLLRVVLKLDAAACGVELQDHAQQPAAVFVRPAGEAGLVVPVG